MKITDRMNLTNMLILHGYAGSTAEAYAEEYGYMFVPFEDSFEDAEYKAYMEE